MIFGVENEKIWCPEFILITEYQFYYQMFQTSFLFDIMINANFNIST